MTDFRDSGVGETVKGAVHGALMTVAVGCGTYNFCAWLKRRGQAAREHRKPTDTTHLAVNAALYLALVGFEIWQVVHHVHRTKEPS